MRERGLSPGGINLRARAINSYLTWLHEDSHLSERLKIKMLRNPPKPIQTLTISPELRKHLFRFQRQAKGRYVFAVFSGAPIERHNAYQELRNLCRVVGITTHVHPHCFRHSYAVHATKNGLDVFRLSRILGHSSINTTQIYLRSIGFDHLQDGAKCSPLGRAGT